MSEPRRFRYVRDKETNGFAWCNCFDSLQSYEELDNKGLIKAYWYYCLGCDEWYQLKKVERPETYLEEQ